MAATTDCLYSTVRCSASARTYFAWLPPHGTHLDPDEEFHVLGDVRESIRRGDPVSSTRNTRSFEAALTDGAIEILQTPAPILYDQVDPNKTPQMLVLVNGVLGLADPCWVDVST